jgi:hypothetical protein
MAKKTMSSSSLFNSFQNWIERQKIPLKRVRDPSKARMWLSDFRKFAKQFGDVTAGMRQIVKMS